jgi:glutamyl-tRNA reductase
LNHRSAAVETREKFWFSEDRSYRALEALTGSAGIEEAVLISTCNRTEFVLWANDLAAASESLRQYLARQGGLSTDEWAHFYRFVGQAGAAHLFRVASGLDSMIVGEPEITGQVKAAWSRAQRAGACGRMLDATFQKALNVSKRARSETAIGNAAVSMPYAAVELARQIFGSLQGRNVLVIGAGKMSELSARYLAASGAREIHVTNRTLEHARQVAQELGGRAVAYDDRWACFAQDDIVISSTGCPHVILTREDAERIRTLRQGRPIFLIDIAVPRDIDAAVRDLPGMYLYDIDDLERVVERNLQERRAAAGGAERIVQREAAAFFARLDAERVVPTIIALRQALEEIRREEMDGCREALSPLSAAQEKVVEEMTARITQRIANRLARELKHVEEKPERDQLAAALRRLFRLAPASGTAIPAPAKG